jgi:hypothetical protein
MPGPSKITAHWKRKRKKDDELEETLVSLPSKMRARSTF